MDMIKIRSCFSQDVTVIANQFLDRFLPEANGDFLKIYLYLIRSAGKGHMKLTLSSIADHMNCTENDVRRALRYWEKAGVLTLSGEEEDSLTDLTFKSYCTENDDVPSAGAAKPSDITSERMAELGEREEVRQSFFVAQQYIGRPLTRGEMQKICYFYDTLRFSADLIDYLIEYCVSRGHKSFHYIEKVALNWKEQGVATIRDARLMEGSYHREYYDILKALGINNHHPVEAEIRLMKKWIERYGFSMEIIEEACSRTIMGAAKPTLNYTDSILSRWHQAGVRTAGDIRKLDEEHARSKNASASRPREAGKPKAVSGSNFPQRDYDYSELEAQLLKKQGAAVD